MNTEKVTRLEIIDHSPCYNCFGVGVLGTRVCPICIGEKVVGRQVVPFKGQLSLSLQDDDKTLKIFMGES